MCCVMIQGQRGLGAGGLGRGSGSLTKLCANPGSPALGGADAAPTAPTVGPEPGTAGPPPPTPAEEFGPPPAPLLPLPAPTTECPPGGGGAESCGVVECACCSGTLPV